MKRILIAILVLLVVAVGCDSALAWNTSFSGINMSGHDIVGLGELSGGDETIIRGIVSLPDQSGCSVYRNWTDQQIPSGELQLVYLQGEKFDIQGEWDADAYIFEPKKAGYYMVFGHLLYSSALADKQYIAYIFVNSVCQDRFVTVAPGDVQYLTIPVSSMVYVEEGGNIIIKTFHDSGIVKTLPDGLQYNVITIFKVA